MSKIKTFGDFPMVSDFPQLLGTPGDPCKSLSRFSVCFSQKMLSKKFVDFRAVSAPLRAQDTWCAIGDRATMSHGNARENSASYSSGFIENLKRKMTATGRRAWVYINGRYTEVYIVTSCAGPGRCSSLVFADGKRVVPDKDQYPIRHIMINDLRF
jgi:hypothetical protein